MTDRQTRPAADTKDASGPACPGTLGFDLYLAVLGIERRALQATRLPGA